MTRWRLDQEALFVALDRRRRRERLSWRGVAAQSTVPASTFNRIGQGKSISGDALVRLLLWLGETDVSPYAVQTDRGERE